MPTQPHADLCAYYERFKKRANEETVAALERALRPDTADQTAKKIQRFITEHQGRCFEHQGICTSRSTRL